MLSPIPQYCANQIIKQAQEKAATTAVKAFKQTLEITGSFTEANQTATESWKQSMGLELPEILELEIEINHTEDLKLELTTEQLEDLQTAILIRLKNKIKT